nr:ribonuclease H-like domain-containing protein [Tanacetum cinerariifolium]
KSPVELSTGYRNLSAQFENPFANIINEVNVPDSPVPIVGQISTNNTNTFSAVGLFNTAVSTIDGKSSYVDTSQYPDDPNMPELEDITYSDDEEDVGVEANFTNLEITITVSPIPTTRVHKDHHVTKIIGDLSSTTQTRSMKRVAKDQGTIKEEVYVYQPPGFEDPDYLDKVYKVVKELYGLHQAPRAWLQPSGGYHVVPPQIIGNFMPPKPDLVFHTAPIAVETNHSAFNIKLSPSEPTQDLSHTNRPLTPIVEEWVFDSEDESETTALQIAPMLTQSKPVSITAVRPICAAVPKIMVTRPRHAHSIDTKSKSIFRRHITYRQSPKTSNSPPKVTAAKALVVSAAQVKRKPDGIFISQDKYVAKILRKFGLTDGKSASTPIDTEKPLLKDPDVRLIVTAVSSKFLLFDASEGFDQIIDFLNASSIKFDLTVNPNIYVSCIKQFWSSVSVKKVNNVIHLQALVDKKKVIITEAIVQEALRLDDAKSIDCLPNEEIFTELSRMGYEKPSTKLTFYKAFFMPQWKFLIHTILQCMSAKHISWNEFSSSMASAVICLSTVGDLSSHTTKYSSPALTQKVFGNMRRVGKGFYRVDMPLFEGMIVAQQADDVADEGAASVDVDVFLIATAEPSIPSPTPTTQPPPPSQELPSTSQQRVKKLERKKKLKVFGLRRLKKVGTAQRVESSADTVMDDQEDASKSREIIANIDANEDVTLKDTAVEKDGEIEENADVQGRLEESQAKIYKTDIKHADKVLSMSDDELEPAELKEVVEVVTTAKLMT